MTDSQSGARGHITHATLLSHFQHCPTYLHHSYTPHPPITTAGQLPDSFWPTLVAAAANTFFSRMHFFSLHTPYPSQNTPLPLPHTSTPSHTPDSFPHTSISPHSPHPSHHTPLSLPHIITLIGINYSQSFVQFLPVYMLWMTLKYCTKQKCHYQHTLTIHSTTIYWILVISSVFRCFNKVRRKAISSLAFWKISV